MCSQAGSEQQAAATARKVPPPGCWACWCQCLLAPEALPAHPHLCPTHCARPARHRRALALLVSSLELVPWPLRSLGFPGLEHLKGAQSKAAWVGQAPPGPQGNSCPVQLPRAGRLLASVASLQPASICMWLLPCAICAHVPLSFKDTVIGRRSTVPLGGLHTPHTHRDLPRLLQTPRARLRGVFLGSTTAPHGVQLGSRLGEGETVDGH